MKGQGRDTPHLASGFRIAGKPCKTGFMVTIGESIRKQRLCRNYTQKYVALNLGTSLANYSKMENGHVRIDSRRLQQIAQILDIPVGDIAGMPAERTVSNRGRDDEKALPR